MIATDCSAFSVASRWAMSSGFAPARPWDGALELVTEDRQHSEDQGEEDGAA